MIWFIVLVVCVLCVIAGFYGIQRTGNYENKWGYLFWYGIGITAIWVIIGLALVLYNVFK